VSGRRTTFSFCHKSPFPLNHIPASSPPPSALFYLSHGWFSWISFHGLLFEHSPSFSLFLPVFPFLLLSMSSFFFSRSAVFHLEMPPFICPLWSPSLVPLQFFVAFFARFGRHYLGLLLLHLVLPLFHPPSRRSIISSERHSPLWHFYSGRRVYGYDSFLFSWPRFFLRSIPFFFFLGRFCPPYSFMIPPFEALVWSGNPVLALIFFFLSSSGSSLTDLKVSIFFPYGTCRHPLFSPSRSGPPPFFSKPFFLLTG